MSENVSVYLYIKPRKIEKSLVSSVVNACLSQDSKYKEDYGFVTHTPHEDHTGALEDAIRVLSKKDGVLWFDTKGIGVYHLSFRPDKSKMNIECITLSTFYGNLEDENKGPKNAQILINIAKAVWNSLHEKPIYGCGDGQYTLSGYVESPDNSPEKNLLSLNFPINKFWLNFYGKKMIEKFGRKKLEEGAYKVEELTDGILVITDVVPKQYKAWWGKTEEEKKEFVKGFMDGVDEYLKKAKK